MIKEAKSGTKLIVIASGIAPVAAFSSSGRVVARASANYDEETRDSLPVLVEKLFHEANVSLSKVEEIVVVDSGESVTGRRCASAFGKGLADARGAAYEEIDAFGLALAAAGGDELGKGVVIAGRSGPVVSFRNEAEAVGYRPFAELEQSGYDANGLIWTKEAASIWTNLAGGLILKKDLPELAAERSLGGR